MQRKIGIFGGTFNPIHNGHLKIARAALNECGLSEIVFMPNGNPPHKKNMSIPDAHLRYEMVSVAISGCVDYSVSDYEIKRTEPSYTIDTYHAMCEIYKCPVYFIIGADSLYTINTWKNPERLIRECKFIVADRNCDEGSNLRAECERLNASGGDFTYLSMEPYDITSTQIRYNINAGIDCSEYIPEDVLRFIVDNNMYKSRSE